MTWNQTDPQGNESGKIVWELVKWTRGKGLDVGCGPNKGFPHMIGVDNGTDIHLFGHQFKPDVWVDDAKDLSLFATDSMDFVYSSHLLEHIPLADVPAALRDWMRVIKQDGYLVLYLPDETLYPKVGEPGANPDHKWNVNYELVIELMKKAGHWDLLDWQRRDGGTEYSLFLVFQKKVSGHAFSCTKSRPEKTCGVVRYGAFGDLLQASSVFAGLKAQGYHITLYTSPPGHEVILHDPNIDEFYLQDKDQVPNQYLDQFWTYHSKKYDKWVNLSESVEGTLLSIPSRFMHKVPPTVRHSMMDRNYLQFQHEVAGVPHKPQVKFYPLASEVEWAKRERKDWKQVLVWSLAGSSIHKVWPWVDNVVMGLLNEFPDLHVVTVGGPAAVLLEQGWFQTGEDGLALKDAKGRRVETHPRVHPRSGDWSIRQTMAFAQTCDIVVGPETGVLNCVAHEAMAKVVFLSHSSNENLTRDWDNTHVLYSANTVCPGRGNNEVVACHQLHYTWEFCQRGKIEAEYKGEKQSVIAACQENITAEEAFKVIWHAMYDLITDKKVA